eukprot:jgi/Mesvir1/11348/Mv21733-RA.1
MIVGNFLSRALIMTVGFVYPAYHCYKVLEKPRTDPEELRHWVRYWMVLTIFAVLERFADLFIYWLPFYYEAKVAFVLFLWHEKTKGADYVYFTFLKPKLREHEPEIDRRLGEVRTRALDLGAHYWSLGLVYLQSTMLAVLAALSQHATAAAASAQLSQGAYHRAPIEEVAHEEEHVQERVVHERGSHGDQVTHERRGVEERDEPYVPEEEILLSSEDDDYVAPTRQRRTLAYRFGRMVS